MSAAWCQISLLWQFKYASRTIPSTALPTRCHFSNMDVFGNVLMLSYLPYHTLLHATLNRGMSNPLLRVSVFVL